MKSKKIMALMMACAITAASIAGCGSGGNDSPTASSGTTTVASDAQGTTDSSSSVQGEDEKMDDVQILNMIMSTPTNLDVNEGGARALMTQVDEGLVRNFTNEKGDYLEPAGAESWDISEDGLIWTFHLRPNAKWSDGVPVTAQHYKDSWLRLLNPDNGYTYAYLLFNVVNGEEYYNRQASAEDVGIYAKDDFTLEVHFDEAAPQFLKQLIIISLYPIRLDVIEAAGDGWESDCTKQVYNGPFVIEELIKDSSMKLVRNEYYWDVENVHLTEVHTVTATEMATQALLFQNGEIDVINAENEYIDKWQAEADKGAIQGIVNNYAATFFVCYNHKTGGPSGLMNNAKIRKAIALSINREEFVDTIYGRYTPAYGLVPFGMQIGEKEFRSAVEEPFKTDYESYSSDPAKIQELFKEGLTELGITADIKDISIRFLHYGSTTKDKMAQEFIQQALENKIGCKVDMNIAGDFSLYKEQRDSGNYDILFTGWYSDYNDPLDLMDLFTSTSGFAGSYGYYTSEKYDELYAQLTGENDMEKRQQLYAEMEALLVNEECGIAPIYYMDSRLFMQNYVKNMFTPMFGPRFEFTRAYIAGKE